MKTKLPVLNSILVKSYHQVRITLYEKDFPQECMSDLVIDYEMIKKE